MGQPGDGEDPSRRARSCSPGGARPAPASVIDRLLEGHASPRGPRREVGHADEEGAAADEAGRELGARGRVTPSARLVVDPGRGPTGSRRRPGRGSVFESPLARCVRVHYVER
jgi:hypothetical protein